MLMMPYEVEELLVIRNSRLKEDHGHTILLFHGSTALEESWQSLSEGFFLYLNLLTKHEK